MKSLVYETPINSAEELVARISAAAGEIRNTPEMLSNVRRSMKPASHAMGLLGDATTTNMPVNFDYFCDFIDILDGGPAYQKSRNGIDGNKIARITLLQYWREKHL
ncbi:hypothetical protein TNCV_4181411 [Trichonephila clavipes]|nr:hypothetical protein TNCV_4181411 [Trichonephila clavipes]